MNLTKEQLEFLKKDPIAQLFLSIIDGMEMENEQSKTEKPIVKKVETQKPTLSKLDYDYITKAAVQFNMYLNTARRMGLLINVKDLTLVGSLITIIYSLLRIYIDPDFAGKFVAGLCDEHLESGYLNNLYNDKIRNN